MKTKGLYPFVKGVLEFIMSCFFIYRRYWIYEISLPHASRAECKPKLDNCDLRVIESVTQLKDLVAQGFQFGIYSVRLEDDVDKGAVVFCIFVEKKIAFIRWVVTTEASMKRMCGIPYPVDFLNKEVYLSWSETSPQYRRAGLFAYSYFKLAEFFVRKGKIIAKALVDKNNLSVLKAAAKVDGKLWGEGRYLKVLWWKSWHEKPMVGNIHYP
ncbi:MAG: hypothetical protein FJ004_03410 [Chloroflexi bacterium]|nr:hypothetical protein [Chloroflexota bacterium]